MFDAIYHDLYGDVRCYMEFSNVEFSYYIKVQSLSDISDVWRYTKSRTLDILNFLKNGDITKCVHFDIVDYHAELIEYIVRAGIIIDDVKIYSIDDIVIPKSNIGSFDVFEYITNYIVSDFNEMREVFIKEIQSMEDAVKSGYMS